MSIQICYKEGEYHWIMHDGPDGIDHYTGIGNCLGEVFEQIIQKQLLNSMRYK